MSADKYKFNINTTNLEKIESCYDEKSLIKASELIKNYCKKTQCKRCVFGKTRDNSNVIFCTLLERTPCCWNLMKGEEE